MCVCVCVCVCVYVCACNNTTNKFVNSTKYLIHSLYFYRALAAYTCRVGYDLSIRSIWL